MNSFKTFAVRTLGLSILVVGIASQANAAIFFRTGVVVAPVVVAPVVAAPVVAAPVIVVPACRFVSVPVVNAWTGVTYLVTRRVCG